MDFPANNPEKPGYRLEWSDEFSADTLDRARWFPHMLPHWSSLEASAARYNIGEGSLRLRIDADQGVWRPDSDRASNLQTGHYRGQFRYDSSLALTAEVPNERLYTPRFGYFETRLKAVPVVGYHVALWMIGYDAAQAGEIRVFEIHGGNIHAERSRVDYGILAWNDPQLRDECFEDWLPINAAEYHVYGVEWTPERVDFFVDNRKLRSLPQSPQYAMQFMLGVYERPHEVRPGGPAFPRVCEVDYFRAYQPDHPHPA